jgi:FtsZ-binding cell division protein ZapB
VFVENNVEIDEDQVDVVEALAAEVDELKEGMNALIEERQALQAQLVEAAREKAVGEVSEGMTVSDAEKFRVLTEEVEASDLSAFRRKIEVIREAMFKAPTSKEDAATVLTESVEPEQSNDKFVGAAPEVLAYAKAISRTTRR